MHQGTTVNPQMIALARESRGLIYEELGTLIGISKSHAWKLEQPDSMPDAETISRIARALNYPESFFYQSGEVAPIGLLYHRKRDNVPMKMLAQIDAFVSIYRLNMEKFLPQVGFRPVKIPLLDVTKHGTPQQCAQRLRKMWKLKRGPIDNLSGHMEEHGVILLNCPFGSERVDARCTVASGHYPIIVTNHSPLGDRLRFTLAYQLGHLAMHVNTTVSSERDISHEANLFAAELLMPEDDIRSDLENLSLPKLADLKRKWKVSMQALLYRASDLEMITYNQQRYILTQFNQLNIRRREPKELDVPIERYKLAKDLLTFYRTKQKLSLSQFSHFLNLHTDDFISYYNS